MNHLCPDCRTPIISLMMIESNNGPEFYCERCCRATEPTPAPKRPVTR